MNKKALKTLEYNKIIDRLAGFAASSLGKEKCHGLMPGTVLADVEAQQNQTTEAYTMIMRKGRLSLGGLTDITASLKRIWAGGVLNSAELIAIANLLNVCGRVKKYFVSENKNETYPSLEGFFGVLMPISSLQNEIERCILSEMEIADSASAALLDTRRQIKASHAKIKDTLNSMIHSSNYKDKLQDAVITIRNGRFCVPVKFEYRNAVSGMVHDQSSTGATLFVEPSSVVSLNNKIKELEIKEKAEIEKVLSALTNLVAEHTDALAVNLETLTELDFIFAKGELSVSMKASRPTFNTEGRINIKQARHPLLTVAKVVPIDIYLGEDFTTLLITGPNTGGKTVSLKTLGLFSLMGQAGLHIPAFDGSELNVFDNIFADIGDEQSIEQSLSTFSSHMTNIVSILDEVTDNSLVLLDELGAGTDPTEGAALAQAILNMFHERQIRTAITTHYSELKVYAIETKGAINASCEFDVSTLRPTYRLLIGVPGKSNAFEISRKLGLDSGVIERAKAFVGRDDARFENVITDLEISKKSVVLEQERAEQYRLEAEKLKKEFEVVKQKIEAQREKILLQAKEEARKITSDAKDVADGLVKEISRAAKAQDVKNLNEQRQNLKSTLNKMGDELKASQEANRKYKQPKNLKVGDSVHIIDLNQPGVVATVPDSSGMVTVRAGIMKVVAHISNLGVVKADKTKEAKVVAVQRGLSKAAVISPEVDLRGQLADEAVANVDKYLDDSFLSGLSQITIIHGKGTGALKRAVHQHLRKHPHVESYRLGKFGEGEDGVTIVEFK